MTAWSSGALIALWPEPLAWGFFGGALVSTNVSGVSGYGFAGAATDGASGAWMPQYSGGNLVNLAANGTVTAYALPAGIFTGCAYSPTRDRVYAITASGQIYVPSGSGVIAVGAPLASPPAWGLAASGASLFALLPAVSGIGTFALSATGAGTSGFIATPMPVPLCLSAAAGAIAVGGYTYATIACGFSDIDIATDVVTNMLAVAAATNAIDLYTGVNEVWSFSQRVSGSGAPSYVKWSPDGLTAFVTDPVSGKVSIVGYSVGVITVNQTLTVSGASAAVIMPGNVNALVCQPVVNKVAPVNFASSVWATGAALTVTNPRDVVAVAASGAAVAFASGVGFYDRSGTTWSLSASAALAFMPTALATDGSGNVYAAGTQGASGYLSIFSGHVVQQTVTWPGSGVGVVYRQGQIVVGDPSANVLRVFGGVPGAVAQQTTAAAPLGLVNGMAIGAETYFAPGSGAVWEYQFTSPYTLARLRSGMVSVYTSGAWASATIGVGQWPEALTFDASGNVWAATLQNEIYEISSAGSVLSSAAIAQLPPQPEATPIGSASLLFVNGHLYAASSLAGALVQIN